MYENHYRTADRQDRLRSTMPGTMMAMFIAVAAPPAPWSWDHVSTFVHCSNRSGPLNNDIVELMAKSSFTVIEKYQCLECDPVEGGGEDKVLAAAKQIRSVNSNATIIFYFAVDYTRRWYDLGVWFDDHSELEVHNADGSLAEVHVNDDGANTWHVFDFAREEAIQRWANDVGQVVKRGLLDGVFIDGYRGTGGGDWPARLIPHANSSTKAAWLQGAWHQTGVVLAKTIPNTTRFPNGNGPTVTNPPPGYNAVSIEFFTTANIAELQSWSAKRAFIEVHSYIGDNRGLFNITLAAFLVSAGENAYFGAGSTWDTCESWLIDYQIADYAKPLGAPDGLAIKQTSARGITYTRRFGTGTRVALTLPPTDGAAATSCIWWSDGTATGNAC